MMLSRFRPNGVTPPTTLSKSVGAGKHHGWSAGAPYPGTASPPPSLCVWNLITCSKQP